MFLCSWESRFIGPHPEAVQYFTRAHIHTLYKSLFHYYPFSNNRIASAFLMFHFPCDDSIFNVLEPSWFDRLTVTILCDYRKSNLQLFVTLFSPSFSLSFSIIGHSVLVTTLLSIILELSVCCRFIDDFGAYIILTIGEFDKIAYSLSRCYLISTITDILFVVISSDASNYSVHTLCLWTLAGFTVLALSLIRLVVSVNSNAHVRYRLLCSV